MSVQTISNCLIITAYFFLWFGMTSSIWRRERGYDFTLWQRCDRHGCIHEVTGLKSYLALVRCGALVSLISLTVCVSVILVGRFSYRCRKKWHTTAVDIFVALAALVLAGCLCLYGTKTVMKGKRNSYPALGNGFTLCAFATMFTLGGSILRVMGPVRTWEDGFSFLLPKDGLLLENRYKYCKQRARHQRHHTPGLSFPLFSMFNDKGNSYYAYASVASSRSGTFRRHSYEEIDVNEMPAPPPEMLESLPPPPPPPPPCPAPRTITSKDSSTSGSIKSEGSSRPPSRPKRSRNHQSNTLHTKAQQQRKPCVMTHNVRYHTMPSLY